MNSEVQLKTWQDQVEAQKSSGLNVRRCCAENGINEKTFYYCMRKVREMFSENQPALVPLEKMNFCIHFTKMLDVLFE